MEIFARGRGAKPNRAPAAARKESSGEGTPAATAPRRLGILEHEALPHQVFLIIERGVVEVEIAFGIDKNAGAVLFEDLVAIARFGFEAHRVRQARAPTPLHTHSQAARFGDTFFIEQLA